MLRPSRFALWLLVATLPLACGAESPPEDADRGPAAVRADFQALREHLGLETVHAIG